MTIKHLGAVQSQKTPEWLKSSDFVPYLEAVATMEGRVDAILRGQKGEAVWFLEHPPLYTAGTSASPDEIVGKPSLPIFQTGRGGRLTYHGPGQRVAYVLCDLRLRGRDIHAHVARLEDWVIRTLARLEIKGEKRQGRVGIWVETPAGEKKIAAIGVRVRRWVTYHGLSLNVAPDLEAYQGIIPCGLAGFGVTSLKELGRDVSMAAVDEILKEEWSAGFENPLASLTCS